MTANPRPEDGGDGVATSDEVGAHELTLIDGALLVVERLARHRSPPGRTSLVFD